MDTEERLAALEHLKAKADARLEALEHLLAALLKEPDIAPNAGSAFSAAEASLFGSSGPGSTDQKTAARCALQEIRSIADIEQS